MNKITSVLPIASSQSPRLKELPPLSLYIHIPWCIKKCPYCDFNSHGINVQEEMSESDYVIALKHDLELSLPQIWGRPIVSVFFGGGTPSLFSAASIDAILSHVRMLLPLTPDTEITLEANPGTFEAQKFRDYQAAGINRLSIGIQSFNSQHLQALGRIHDGCEAHRAAEIALKNFSNINLDLMYALPDQTQEEARQDIEAACDWGVSHISAYHLTIEPNTLFYHNPPKLPDEEVSADMQIMIEQILVEKGYQHYEVSAFARPGLRCLHNMNYWHYGDYLGIGAGAHSKISFQDKIVRQMRYKHPRQYLESAKAKNTCFENLIAVHQEVNSQERAFEFMMNALRLTSGFDPRLFHAHTGLPISSMQEKLVEAEQRELIVWSHDRIFPTLTGRRFLNDLLQIFLPMSKQEAL
jgi:putative oxygen-independent coproporphyrinogen III oxidase